MGCTLPVGPRAPPADEIRGAEPLHPLRQVSAPWAERAPWGPLPAPHDAGGGGGAAPQSRSREVLSWGCRGLRCNQEAHRSPSGRRRVQLLQQGKCRKPEVPAAHLGSMALITSLPGTGTRETWLLDLHHAAEHSDASSEGQVFWPWAQVDSARGCHCHCSTPLLSPIPSTWSIPPLPLPCPQPGRWRRYTLHTAPFAGTAPLWTW